MAFASGECKEPLKRLIREFRRRRSLGRRQKLGKPALSERRRAVYSVLVHAEFIRLRLRVSISVESRLTWEYSHGHELPRESR